MGSVSKTTLIEALRAAGYRLTRQRRAILAYLGTTNSHPSARQIFQEVRKIHPGLSLATVYNTLGVLVDRGLIKVLEFELDNRYEVNLNPHINLICTLCGKIQDLTGEIPCIPEKIEEQVGFQVMDYRLEYYGICPECREKGVDQGLNNNLPGGKEHE